MMFLVFVSTSSMVIMASTITCRCWLDSDPERQAMLMVLTGSPYGSPRVSAYREGRVWRGRQAVIHGVVGKNEVSSGRIQRSNM